MHSSVLKQKKNPSWTSNKNKSFMWKYEGITSCTTLLITVNCQWGLFLSRPLRQHRAFSCTWKLRVTCIPSFWKNRWWLEWVSVRCALVRWLVVYAGGCGWRTLTSPKSFTKPCFSGNNVIRVCSSSLDNEGWWKSKRLPWFLQIDTAVTPLLLQDGFSRSSMIKSCSVTWLGRLEVLFLSRLLREMGSREVCALLAGSTEFPWSRCE